MPAKKFRKMINPVAALLLAAVGSSHATAACVDSDGDGWGWDGNASYLVERVPPIDPTDESIFDDIPCIDSDGDGWGWQQPYAGVGRSCKVSNSEPTPIPEMVTVRAGCFDMGSPESEPLRTEQEGPQFNVCVNEFAISSHEITFA